MGKSFKDMSHEELRQLCNAEERAKRVEKRREYQQKYMKKWWKNNPEYKAEYRKNNLDRVRAVDRARYTSNAEYIREYKRAWREKHGQENEFSARSRIKLEAKQIIHQAVRAGIINRPDTCSVCSRNNNEKTLHGHHEDYNKPYEVIWICAQCHADIHRAERNA